MAKIVYAPHIQSMSGKAGRSVYVQGRSTPFLRARVTPRNPRTTKQLAVRAAHSASAKAYKGLSNANLALWAAYAGTITRKNKKTGQSYIPTAVDIFVGLTDKFLQIQPAGTIALTPPTVAYGGESITVAYSNTLSGTIVFTGSAAQTVGTTTTEILVQALKSNTRQVYAKAYRTFAFKNFAAGNLTLSTSVYPAGTVLALAYRFVKLATGEATPLVAIGKFAVT